MSLLSDAVRVANDATSALGMQATVRLGKYQGDGGTGDPDWKWTTHAAIVEHKSELVYSSDGREQVAHHTITFLNPKIVVNEGDQIKWNGITDTVKSVSSPVDSTGRLLVQAYL